MADTNHPERLRAEVAYLVRPEIFISSLREPAGREGQSVDQCCEKG